MIDIRHFLTDLVQIWYRGLSLCANFKFEAILWIRGREHVEIGDFCNFPFSDVQYIDTKKSESFISLLQTVLMQH